MTAAEMLQAQADIQTDARARLQEIRDEIALLEAEMADLEEVIDG
jgi:cell division protein FtsB